MTLVQLKGGMNTLNEEMELHEEKAEVSSWMGYFEKTINYRRILILRSSISYFLNGNEKNSLF